MPDSISPPSDPYAAFVPTAAAPWDAHCVAHLLRRTGFGATPSRLETVLKYTPQQAVDSLLDYDSSVDPMDSMLDQLDGFVTPFAAGENSTTTAQTWWLYRMIYTERPMQEKIALFWHNRFATSLGKVNNPMMMHRQIQMFRRDGLGNYRDLLIAVGRDPAMLIWLDGQLSQKGKPNENYGREVMELFTLGIGNYTEKDVKELSRAFTGWRIVGGEKSVLYKNLFDDGEKEIFGKKGNFDSESAVDLLLSQPAAPKFLALHLLHDFVNPHPLPEHVDHYAQRLLDNKWEIKPVLKEMLLSRLFYSDWAYRSRIKSPVEMCIGATVALGGRPNMQFLSKATQAMGQQLLYPPNVKGWDGEETWINSTTVLLRFNFGLSLATQRGGEFSKRSDIESFLLKHNIKSSDDIVDYYARLLLDGRPPQEARARFVQFMNKNGGSEKPFELDTEKSNLKVRDLLHLIMAIPEFQLA